MTQTVLPQLQAIEAELAAQEKQLAAQLAEVQEKLAGIHAIMPMFTETSDSGKSSSNSPIKNIEDTSKASETKKPAAKKTTAKKTTASKKKTASKATPKKKTTTARKKKDGRTASWQKYTRPGVKEESIPDAVRLILETQPSKAFKIAEVMDSLFKESMPKNQYLKARNRISNVLSGGVRAGDWYKGERGTYRINAA